METKIVLKIKKCGFYRTEYSTGGGALNCFRSMSGKELYALFKNDKELWDAMVGVFLFHRECGWGKVAEVVNRNDSALEIKVEFDELEEIKLFNPLSFSCGFIDKVVIPQSLYSDVANFRKLEDRFLGGNKKDNYFNEPVLVSKIRSNPRKYENVRYTHCWKCKTELNSDQSSKCESCGWLTCPKCGACGCKS